MCVHVLVGVGVSVCVCVDVSDGGFKEMDASKMIRFCGLSVGTCVHLVMLSALCVCVCACACMCV